MSRITHILIPTDFSEPADAAMNYGVELAKTLGATVSLVHVFVDPVDVNFYSEQFVPMPVEMRNELLAEIRRQLAERAARHTGIAVTHDVLVGPPAQAIVDAARDCGADLIVMGTHGRHGVAHLLLGSVAERVVRTAACPVLTVRPAPAARVEQAA